MKKEYAESLPERDEKDVEKGITPAFPAAVAEVPDEDTGDVVTLTQTLALVYLSPTATHRR